MKHRTNDMFVDSAHSALLHTCPVASIQMYVASVLSVSRAR